VEDYFNKHPEFFSNRKQFGMSEIVIGANDLTPEVRSAADSAKSLEEVAVWLDAHKIKYGRTQITRSTADVPPQLSSKLLGMPKGQLFVVKEGPTRHVHRRQRGQGRAGHAGGRLPADRTVPGEQEEQGDGLGRAAAPARGRQDRVPEQVHDARPESRSGLAGRRRTDQRGGGRGRPPVAEAPNASGSAAAAGAGATQAPTDNGASTDKAALDRGVAGLK
jgi:peptidyl-prolyl cis-trans isomerase C